MVFFCLTTLDFPKKYGLHRTLSEDIEIWKSLRLFISLGHYSMDSCLFVYEEVDVEVDKEEEGKEEVDEEDVDEEVDEAVDEAMDEAMDNSA